jgi:hypothetical protein
MTEVFKCPLGRRVDLEMRRRKIDKASPGHEHLVGIPEDDLVETLKKQGYEYVGALVTWNDGSEDFAHCSKPLDWRPTFEP